MRYVLLALCALLVFVVPGGELGAEPARLRAKPTTVRKAPQKQGREQRQRKARQQRKRKTTKRVARPKLFPARKRAFSSTYKPPKRGKVKIAFFDADGTLRVSKSGSPTANHGKDVVLLPMVARRMKALAKKGYLIAIVSNQAGVEAGYVTDKVANDAIRHTARLLSKLDVPVHYYDYAPRSNEFRKPATGMARALAERVQKSYGAEVNWKDSFMVGDAGYKKGRDTQPGGRPGADFSNSDRIFAENVAAETGTKQGMKFHHAKDFFGWSKLGVEAFGSAADVQSFVQAHPQHDPGVN